MNEASVEKRKMRIYTKQDQRILKLDTFLTGILGLVSPRTQQPVPGRDEPEAILDDQQRRKVVGLMRVNHSGEVCAQALYTGQALTAQSVNLQQKLRQAGREEEDHLHWTAERLRSLEGRESLLNPLWYAGSLSLGAFAGILGNRWSLGFLEETERQVEAHLERHLARLPAEDTKSLAVVWQMKEDEARHAQMARDNGAAQLPKPVTWSMRAAAKVMTTLSYWI